MEYNLVSCRLQQEYKKDFLGKNVTFFQNGLHFLSLKTYVLDEEIKKIIPYLPFVEHMNIFIENTLVDFVNLTFIICYLLEQNYQNKIKIIYATSNTHRYLFTQEFSSVEIKEFLEIKTFFQTRQRPTLQLEKKLIPLSMHLQYIQQLFFADKMWNMILENALEENLYQQEETILYLLNKYQEYGFSAQFYRYYLEKKG